MAVEGSAVQIYPYPRGLLAVFLGAVVALLGTGDAYEKFLESAYDEGNVVQVLPSHVTSTGYAGAGLAWQTPVLRSVSEHSAQMHNGSGGGSFSMAVSPLVDPTLLPSALEYYYGSSLINNYPSQHVDIVPLQLPLLQSYPVRQTALVYSADANKQSRGKEGRQCIWGYDDESRDSLGPSRWSLKFPDCSHRLQSPIALAASDTRFSPLQAIRLVSPDMTTRVELRNLGATVALEPKGREILFGGGNIPGAFKLYNIHFHWGQLDNSGSEHTLDGRSFPLEMHLVTYNSRYRGMLEAAGKMDGIHVVVVWLKRSARPNSALGSVINQLRRVRFPDSQVNAGYINIARLLPPPTVPYFRYRGSLTTPPCTGNVLFSVFSIPWSVSGRQLSQFRLLKLKTVLSTFSLTNSRPVQPRNNRAVLTNDPLFR